MKGQTALDSLGGFINSLFKFICICLFGLFLFWTFFDRHDPASFSMGARSKFHNGQRHVVAEIEVDRKRSCEFTAYRSIFVESNSGKFVKYELGSISRPPIGELGVYEYELKYPIPKSIPAGPAYISILLEYRCNPIQKLVLPIYVGPENSDLFDLPEPNLKALARS